jgi:hypothetical protein
MVTPEYYNDFTGFGGKLPPGNGIYVVAQSGGVNNTFDQRLITKSGQLGKGQQGLDFYIEDLDLTLVTPGANKSTTATDIRFKIIEPNGFTFLTDLNRASSAVVKQSPLLKSSDSEVTSLDQKYILGIRFFGYDVNGNLVKSESKLQSGANSSYSDAYSIAERFIAVRIATLKFKLDGKATVYNVEAYLESEQNTYGKNHGTIKSSAPLVATGGTVREAIEGTGGGNSGNRGLLQFLNESQQDLKARGEIEIATVYKVEWVGGKSNPIPDSKLVDDKSVEQRLTGLSPARTTDKVNISESFGAAAYNPTSRQVTFAAGTTITQALDNLIVKSTYVSDALNQVNDGKPETDTTRNSTGKQLQWYSINPVTRVLGRDSINNDWAYEITYQISVYEMPYARTQYKSSSPKYPGPFKYYSFMLTGENTEVLEYEQTYDNLYYVLDTVSTSPDATPLKDKKSVRAPIHTQGGSTSDPTGGKLYKGSEINDNVKAQLLTTGDQIEAKIKVLGDPDFIMSIVGIKQPESVGSAKSLYGPDFSINPMSGQIFIQIVFNVASDYDDNGLMDVSDKIQFYESNNVRKQGIKGVVYTVQIVNSSFSRGSFTQLLELILVDQELLVGDENESSDNLPAANSGRGTGSSVTGGGGFIGNDEDIRTGPDEFDEEQGSQYQNQSNTMGDGEFDAIAPNSVQAAREVSYAQESANDDQRTVNDRNVALIYEVDDNPALTPEQNSAISTQATVASQRATIALQSIPGSTRTASGQRRFTRSATQ